MSIQLRIFVYSLILFSLLINVPNSAAANLEHVTQTEESVSSNNIPENWLERFNYYRQAAGLPPVVESSAYSVDLAKHVNYMLLNVPAEGLWHGETPGRPGYTPEGHQAAAESNLFWFPSGASYTTPAVAIDGWMGSIYHRFGMLNPELVTTGFGIGCDTQNCGAGLNVIRGLVGGSNPRPDGVIYPGPNQINVNTDIILTWQFLWDPTAILKSASLRNSSGQLIPITTTSPPNGDYFNMVSVKPDTLLSPGTTYTANITVQLGSQELNKTWDFTTTPIGPDNFNKSSPASGAMNQSTSVTLNWEAGMGTDSYEYCYDTTNDNTCSNWTSNGTATSKTLSGLASATTYYWQVRAVNTGGMTYANGNAFWWFKTIPTAAVSVNVGGALQGNYNTVQNSSTRSSYASLDGGPVRMSSTNGVPIVASERVAYSPNGGTMWTSYSELMGLPISQLTSSYTFPWYNNVDLNSQLRFGNVGSVNTTVTVMIGGQVKGSYTLGPNSSQRISYVGLDNGPVRITSTGGVPIIASLRVAYFNGSAWTSFSEMMGLPSNKLTDSYIFPWYNNLDLNSQLRFGNVGNSPTTITVTIGGIFKGNYNLAPNESKRVSYAGLDGGPVRVTSSGNVSIIASLRVAYHDGSAWTDFSEMMGLPIGSLSTRYSFPIYNNLNLNTQLRFANVGNATTTATVTIGGVLKGTYILVPNESKRVNYAGVDGGPVVIQSSGNIPIIASERVAYFNGSAWSSFAEMMGLPKEQLTSTFLFPWYNNINLDTQLRFGVP